jgi:hypothetical protein
MAKRWWKCCAVELRHNLQGTGLVLGLSVAHGRRFHVRLASTLDVILWLGIHPAQSQEAAPPPTPRWIDGDSQCWGIFSADRAAGAAPASDDEARATAWERRHDLTPLCLYEAAAWWANLDAENAGELFALAMLRARYDVLRCREPEQARNAPTLFRSVEITVSGQLRARRDQDPAWWPQMLQRTAAADETFRYDGRRLESVCEDAGGATPRSRWRAARDRVRAAVAPLTQ